MNLRKDHLRVVSLTAEAGGGGLCFSPPGGGGGVMCSPPSGGE